MKTYLITMFTLWIVRAVILLLVKPTSIDQDLANFAKFLGFCGALGMAIWTGLLLF